MATGNVQPARKLGARHATCGSVWLVAALASLASSHAAAAGDDVAVRWEPVDGAAAYAVEVAADAGFQVIMHTERVATNALAWEPPTPGILWLRVASIDRLNRPGPFSTGTRLIVTYAAPDLSAPNNATTLDEGKPYRFTWEKVPSTLEYVLEVSRTPTFNNLWLKRVRHRDPYATIQLPAGQYHWRVGAKYASNLPMIYGTVREVTVNPVPVLARPSEPPPVKLAALATPSPPSRSPDAALALDLSTKRERHEGAVVALGYAPALYHYEMSSKALSTRLKALMFNSMAANLEMTVRGPWALRLKGQRASTYLFEDEKPTPSGQQPALKVAPSRFAVAAVRRQAWASTSGSVDLRLGFLRKSVFLLRKTADKHVEAVDLPVHGLVVGMDGRLPVAEAFAVELLVDIERPVDAAAGTALLGGMHWLSEVALRQSLKAGGLFLRYAYAYEDARLRLRPATDDSETALRERRQSMATSLGWLFEP